MSASALKKHYEKVASLCCLACRINGVNNTPAELHHPYGRCGDNEFKVIPLCPPHHRSGNHESPVSAHGNGKAFYQKYGSKDDLLNMVDDLLANQMSGDLWLKNRSPW